MSYHRWLKCIVFLAVALALLPPSVTQGDDQRHCLLQVILWDVSIVKDGSIGDEWDVTLFVNEKKIPLFEHTSSGSRAKFTAHPVEIHNELLRGEASQLRIKGVVIEHDSDTNSFLNDTGPPDERTIMIACTAMEIRFPLI